MANKSNVLNMKCDVCGTEIVVSTSAECRLEPIYCCGLEIVDVGVSDKNVPLKQTEGETE